VSPFPGFGGHKSAPVEPESAPVEPESAPVVADKSSAITTASNAFVAAHMDQAAALGHGLATLVGSPQAFITAIEQGFTQLGDPTSLEGMARIAPGLGESLGVRLPLMEAVLKSFKRGSKNVPTPVMLDVVGELLVHRYSEVRWFGMWNLERYLKADTDRTWQLMRMAAAGAAEWITVDTLAHPYATGILREPRRWSDLQAFVHSSSRWERRLVGSTVATLPHVRHAGAKDKGVASRGLMLIGMLVGDPEPDVQKALSWALRSLAPIDPEAVTAFVERETATAIKTNDGNRAWVLRDTLPKLPKETAATIRRQLDGLRRRPGTPSKTKSTKAGAAPRPSISSREE
jgi:3-methyladenine DNA glycosylase AlkD